MADHTAQHSDDAQHTHHIVPPSLYVKVFGGLMVLLVLTLEAARHDIGPWNLVIAMVIAVAKAGLIVLYFMHLKYNTSLVRFFAGAALFWLSILFVMTLTDYISRGPGLGPTH